MKLRPYTNTQKHAMHIGTKTIWPGDTREVDETLHPDYEPTPPASVPAVDIVAELLAQKVADILPKRDDASDSSTQVAEEA